MYSLKKVFRGLRQNILYSSINVIGLAISLVTVILILLWIQDELSYDRFHKNADNTYVVVASLYEEGHVESSTTTPGILVQLLKERFGELEIFCRTRNHPVGFIEYGDKKLSKKTCVLTDSTFFSLFSFPIVEGQQANLLQNPSDVVISERLSMQLFDNEDPIGKTIKLENIDAQVVAVVKNIPRNTYFYGADLFCSFSSNLSPYHLKALDDMGYGAEYMSFLRVSPNADLDDISAEFTKEAKKTSSDIHSIWFQPLTKLHLYSVDDSVSGILIVRMFLLIALVILMIACINYISLVTARASKRAGEIGLKKIVGARKPQLFMSFLTEAIVLFILAIVIAVILILFLLPLYNQLSGKELVVDWLNPNVWLIFFGSFLTIILIAGVYPAILLTTYKPLCIMKGGVSRKGTNSLFRKILVVVQLVFSVVFIVSTITLHAQMGYIRQKSLGYDKEHVFMVTLYNAADHFSALKTRLMQHSSIKGVTAASENIMSVSSGHVVWEWEGKTSASYLSVNQERIDTSFLEVMRIPLIAGEGFTSGYEAEYVFNESAIKAMGIDNPIGKRVKVMGLGTIVGVVEDFHYATLHEPVRPLVLYWHNLHSYRLMFVRTTAADASSAIAVVDKAWSRYNSEYTFTYTFLDDSFNYMYHVDHQIEKLFDVFTVIAMLISCLGLFGLVTYTAEAKTKEIGVRKTLGASTINIIIMLSREFIVLIGIAVLIAFPLAYYLLDLLLQNYAYRISMSWQIFVLAAFITLALTILTVSAQALKAARANPVKSIKTE